MNCALKINDFLSINIKKYKRNTLMHIYPAIDIKDNKAVRLYKGDFDKISVYENDPKTAAERFYSEGASKLHIVDLDGALSGKAPAFETIGRIAQNKEIFIELGGGIRTQKRIEEYFSLGVNRVILGTSAVNDRDFLVSMIRKFSDRIAVGVDTLNGYAALEGWKNISKTKGEDFLKELRDIGVQNVIYTDISRDGTLQGTNLALYERLSNIKGINIIASGGISTIDEITRLKEIGIYGAVLGKALYTGAIDLKQALKAAGDDN